MRKIFTLLMALPLVLAITGCSCKHEWTDATCQLPKTCTLCGETEGEPLPHNWIDATCTAPKTCTLCAATEGEAPGHSWVDATCETARTCSLCAASEGDALGHTFGQWTCTGEQFLYPCTVCGKERSLTPEEFCIRHLAGTQKLSHFTEQELGETITIHEDGTVELDLKLNLYCPDALRLVFEDICYFEDNRRWRLDFYLDDYLIEEGRSATNPEAGYSLHMNVDESNQEIAPITIVKYVSPDSKWTAWILYE